MTSPVDDIAFLANSENRVSVLNSLTDGPHSRHVLVEKTDVSRVTLGRILDELETRQWITQRGQVCKITPLGAWVVEEFNVFADRMEAAQELRKVLGWFPKEAYGFHVSCLADAEITLVSRAEASAPISRLVQQFGVGGRFRAFSFAITSQFLEACWRHVMDERITWEWVFTSEVLDVLKNNQAMASHSRDMIESGRAEYRQYEDEIPYVVIISEEMVNLRLADDDGAATALLQSDETEVRAWAETTFEDYWRDGTTIGADVFTP